MSFPNSAGLYGREVDQSYRVPAVANSIAGIVIHALKGNTGEIKLITSVKEFLDTYGDPTPNDISMYCALAFLEKGNRLLVTRAINDAIKSTVTFDDIQGSPALAFTVNAKNEGVWGNSLTVSTSASVDDIFTLTIKLSTVIVETFTVTRNPLSKNGFGQSQYIEDVVNKESLYVDIIDNVAIDWTLADVETAADSAMTTGADDTTAPDDADINVEWDRFAIKEEVEVSLLVNAGWATATVHQKMIALAEARKDCFAILDFSSSDATVANMVTYAGTTLNANTSFAAIYAGWVYIYDQYNDKFLYVPNSGHVAGVYANTAEVSEVWYAPAGSRRGIINVLGVETVWTDGERDTLYTAQINPIQNFTGQGIQIYGQKTLQSAASATDRVNVRMLLIDIEKSISKALLPYVFEFNDSFTRDNIASIINAYMTDIKVRRGVYDFATVVDESNNTATIIDQNKLIVDLYVKPTRVAEFLQLNVIITPTGATFTTS